MTTPAADEALLRAVCDSWLPLTWPHSDLGGDEPKVFAAAALAAAGRVLAERLRVERNLATTGGFAAEAMALDGAVNMITRLCGAS